jgi:hypothetical protein
MDRLMYRGQSEKAFTAGQFQWRLNTQIPALGLPPQVFVVVLDERSNLESIVVFVP